MTFIFNTPSKLSEMMPDKFGSDADTIRVNITFSHIN